jgi:hypothetical protein
MAARLVEPHMSFLDGNGDPLASGLLQFNEPGSPTTAKATYSDEALTTANANPIVLDSAGRIPSGTVDVWGDGQFRMIVKNSAGTVQETYDPIGGVAAGTGATLYADDTGAADAYVIAPTPAITAYTTGQRFAFFPDNSNTGASTLAVSGLAAKAIKKGTSALASGDIVSGDLVECTYDGTDMILSNNPRFNIYTALTAGQLDFNAANPEILGQDTDGVIYIGASTTTSLGCVVKLYGDTHATQAGDYEILVNGTVVMHYDHSATTMDFKSAHIATDTAVMVGSSASDTGDGTVDADGGYFQGGVAIQTCKAWVNFKGSDTFAERDSFNVSGVVDNGPGLYTVTIDTNMANNTYCATVTGSRDSSTDTNALAISLKASTSEILAAGSVQVAVRSADNSIVDAETVCVAVFGDS